jgi:hypothetical protein
MQKQKQKNLTIYLILSILMVLITTLIFNNGKIKNPFELQPTELTAEQKKDQIIKQLKDNPIYSYTDGTNWGLKNYKTGQVLVEPQFKSIITFPVPEDKNLGIYFAPNPLIDIFKTKNIEDSFKDKELGVIDYRTMKVTKYPNASALTKNFVQQKADTFNLLNFDGSKVFSSKYLISNEIKD